MNHFPLPLIGQFLNGKSRTFQLVEPFQFIDIGINILVPRGFITDFNSVPRGFWNVFPPWEYPEAGIVHDYLYRTKIVDRSEADAIHRRILELKQCPMWKRWVAWAALRIGGLTAWRKGDNR